MLGESQDISGYISNGYGFFQTYGHKFTQCYTNITLCIYHILKFTEAKYHHEIDDQVKSYFGDGLLTYINSMENVIENNELYMGTYHEDYDYGLTGNYEYGVKHNHDNEWDA